MTNLFVRSGISFVDRSEVLTHIGNEMLAKGVVHDTATGINYQRSRIPYRDNASAARHCNTAL